MTGSPMGGALRQIHHLFVEGTVAGLPDGQLLERFLARGDEAAFAALVERHGPMVLGICRSVLRDPTTSRTPSRPRSWSWSARPDRSGARRRSAAGCTRSPIASPSRPGRMPPGARACERRAGAGRADDLAPRRAG